MAHMKIPEKFSLILENGEQLLERLYLTKNIFNNAKLKPVYLADEKIAKVLKNLISKFPELPENNDKTLAGFDQITSRSKQIYEELETHYETLVDSNDWREACFQLLQEISSNTVAISFSSSIQLSGKFLQMITMYGKINYMVSLINDRKVIAAVYAKVFQFIRSAPEPNYQRLGKFLNEYSDAPVKKIQEEFRVLNDSIGKVLMSLEPTYQKRRIITLLRKDGALNLTLKPEDIARPVQDQYRIELAYASTIYQWILYGFLFAPGTLNTPQAIELVRYALTEGFNLPVFKEISFPIHNEFNTLFKTYKGSKQINLQKQKKIIKDSAQASTQEAPRKHAERRVYIRQELEAMWNLFRDKPCLLAPKINVLLAALSMAKEEIFWYFRHVDVIPPEKVKKYYNKQFDVKEKRVASILSLIDHLVNLVLSNKKIIQSYYIEYIIGADLLGLNKILSGQLLQSAGPVITQAINSIMNEIKSIQLGQVDYNFFNFRSNWLRLEYLLSSQSCTLRADEVKQIASRFNLVFIHSKNVDSLEQQLYEYANLTHLWPFKDALIHVFDQSIMEGADQPTHSMIFLKLLSQFPDNATQYFPEEKEQIGKECVEIASQCLTKLTGRIVSILTTTVVSTYLNNEYQLADVNAAFPLLQKKKDWKPPKDFVPPIEPGSESAFRNRVQLEQLRAYEKNAFQLCTSLNDLLEIVIYDHAFIPREFLREKLGQALKQFLKQALAPPPPTSSSQPVDTTITRPSVVETQLQVFLGVMLMVENYVDIDIGDLIRQTLLTEFYAKALGKPGRIDWFPEGEIEMQDLALHYIVNHVNDLISKKLTTPGVVYTPVRLGFLSKTGIPFRAEDHADLVEMRALCNLVGPYGIKVVEREILRFVQTTCNQLKEILSINASNLEEFSQNYHKPLKAMELLKKFKSTDFDQFVQKSIAIGNALHLRSMMRDSMKDVISDTLPYINESIDNAFQQYDRNIFMYAEFLGVDVLALDSGLDVGIADQYLKVLLKKSCSEADKKIWDLLPVMYALCFYGSAWKDASFKPPIDAHFNNVHTLSKTIIDLLIAFGVNSSTTGNIAEITASFKKFLEISAVIILRMFKAKGNEKYIPNEIQSVVIFLDKFTQQCPIITKDVLENYLPYSLIRNMYRDLYENRETKVEANDHH
ncbi:component of SCAR regulatory complex [Tieghemostelium lacteum]|uniref:Component of SCAR regulatory complex n=1 Tax=Tieghemostelium lacteum TaxID=361077 RepID=A0A151Z6V6_TIELA|nr:component of SCAR regulatory complex [Tieghemostelium lacteum]|eukprot:KYQ89693.1 component of SCAR regulatory complex [Tieghemostelium lacteum]